MLYTALSDTGFKLFNNKLYTEDFPILSADENYYQIVVFDNSQQNILDFAFEVLLDSFTDGANDEIHTAIKRSLITISIKESK